MTTRNKPAERKAYEGQFWDRRAGLRQGFRYHLYTEVNDYLCTQMLRAVGDLHGRRVLFVGCGTSSAMAEAMARRGADVWCVDISPGSLGQLMIHPFGDARCRIHPVVADAEKMAFRDHTFDVIIGRAILHHLDIPVFMAEADRVAASGARIVFSEPLGANPLINLFRWLTPGARVPTEHPLARADIERVKASCAVFHCTASFLFSLASVPCFFLGLRLAGRWVMKAGNAVDRIAFAICPPLRWLAWNVLLVGQLRV